MKYFGHKTTEIGQRDKNSISGHICGVDRAAVRSHPVSERGFSLIEMMISITIGMLIIVALVGVLVSNSRTAKSNDRTSELQSNGRYALDHLTRGVRAASYRGFTWANPTVPLTTPIVAPTNECLEGGAPGGSFVTNIRQGIWGANDSNPYGGNCLAGDRYLSDDVLVLRHTGQPLPDADGVAPYVPALKANTFYFESTFAYGEVFQGVTPPAMAGTLIADFPLHAYVYYIGKDDDDATLPALRRIALKGNGDNCNGTAVTSALMCDEMVASLIEHMQLQFGYRGTNMLTQYHEANEVVGTSTDSQVTDWEAVNSVRIWLLARNAKAEPGYKDTNTYDMGDQHFRPNDGFRRQLFTAVVQLRN